MTLEDPGLSLVCSKMCVKKKRNVNGIELKFVLMGTLSTNYSHDGQRVGELGRMGTHPIKRSLAKVPQRYTQKYLLYRDLVM